MNYEYIALGAGGLSIVLLLALIWLFIRVAKIDRIRKEFLVGDSMKTLDDTLVDHNQNIDQLKSQLDELGTYVSGLATANKRNFQKIGFVRFNPFGDAGGAISFAIALLDAEGNGFVLSSLHGREGNRVYSKEIEKGISKSQLTEEEQQAINEAK